MHFQCFPKGTFIASDEGCLLDCCLCETLLNLYHMTGRGSAEDGLLLTRRRENLKSHRVSDILHTVPLRSGHLAQRTKQDSCTTFYE